MRLKKPTRAVIDQVRITREGNDAIVDYAGAAISGTRFTIGPGIATMTNREIIDVFNGIIAAQEQLLAAWDKTVTEEAPGEKQMDYHEDSDQWVPRGDVLRCIIDDGGLRETSPFISTTRNCHSPNSAGCSGFMRVGNENRVRA